jgi:hypothetical protein
MVTERTVVAKIAAQLGSRLQPDNAQWTNRFEIRSGSSDRLYIVAQQRQDGAWGCSCPGWRHHRRCRHLTDFLRRLTALADKMPAAERRPAHELVASARTAYLLLEPAAAVASPRARARIVDLG